MALKLQQQEFTSFSAPIWGHDAVERPGRPQVYGTATFLEVGPYRLMVTAAHVLDRLREAKSPPHLAQGNSVLALDGTFASTCLPASKNRKDDRVDLAFRLLTANKASGILECGRKFIPLEHAQLTEAGDDQTWYMFCGWPTSYARPHFRDKKAKAQDWKYQDRPQPPTKFAEVGVSPSTHIVVGFNKENVACLDKGRIQAPDPHGISGGPVWCCGKTPSLPVAVTAAAFAGIGIEYLKEHDVLLAIRARVVYTLLWTTIPLIREYLPDLGNPAIPATEAVVFEVATD